LSKGLIQACVVLAGITIGFMILAVVCITMFACCGTCFAAAEAGDAGVGGLGGCAACCAGGCALICMLMVFGFVAIFPILHLVFASPFL